MAVVGAALSTVAGGVIILLDRPSCRAGLRTGCSIDYIWHEMTNDPKQGRPRAAQSYSEAWVWISRPAKSRTTGCPPRSRRRPSQAADKGAGGEPAGARASRQRRDPPAAPVPPPPDAAAMAAREAARSAASLDELCGILERFDGRCTEERRRWPAGVCRRHAGLAADAGRRGTGRRGRPARACPRRQVRGAARLDAGRDRARLAARSISPTSCRGGRLGAQPHADAGRGRRSACRFIQRQIELCDPDVLASRSASPRPARCSASRASRRTAGGGSRIRPARAKSARCRCCIRPICLRSPIGKRLAWRDLLAIKKASGLGALGLRFRRRSNTRNAAPPTAGIAGIPVNAENSATDRPKSASRCENLVAQVTPTSSNGGHWPLAPNDAQRCPRRKHDRQRRVAN